MRSVIYTEDFEPITVIELSEFMKTELERRGSVNVPVYRPMPMPPEPWNGQPDRCAWYVRLEADVLYRRGRKTMFVFAKDEETALLLKSAFLPGQQGSLRKLERRAFAQGFLRAMTGGTP